MSFDGLTSLAPTDDGSSPQTPLGFTLDYFGTDYTSVYVNENGDITFSGPLSTYTPSGIGTVGTDIIAPFFGDADSVNGGATTLYGATTLDGYDAFVAEWPGVDCYTSDGTASDVENGFEVVLINRPDLGAGDFQIEYNYNQVQWDAGEASNGTTSSPNCQSTVDADAAVVGFSNASGSESYELPGSQSDGAFIDSNSSTGLIYNDVNSDTSVSVPASDSPVQGRYIWEVANGSLGTPTSISGFLTSASDSGTSITVTPGAAVQATSTLSGDQVYEANGTVSYTVYSGSGCTGSVYESAGSVAVTDGSPGPSSPVTISAPGTYSWYASYSGDRSNNQASAACIGTQTVENPDQAPLSVTSTSGTATVPLTLTTSGGSGTGAVSYAVADGTASGCAVSSGALSSASAGTCLVTATKAGDANYNATSSPQTTVTLALASQAPLSVTSTSGTATVPLTLTTSGGSGTGAVSYAVADGTASGCAVSSGALNSASAGTCLVTATQAGDVNYSATSSPQTTVTLALASQAPLSVTSTSGTATVPLTLTTSGGSGTGAVSYAVADGTASGCAVSSGTLNSASAGTCLVTATKAGDVNYNATSSPQTTVTLALASQAPLTVTSTSGTATVPLTLTTSGGSGTGAVSYAVADGTASGCAVSSGALSSASAGTCLVTATKAGDVNYGATSSPQTTVTLALASQAPLTVTSTSGTATVPLTLTTSGGSGTGAVSYAVADGTASGCAVSSGALSSASAGTCLVTATEAGDVNYDATSSPQTTVTLALASQAISFSAPASGTVGTGATLSATGGASGNPVVFSIDATSGTGVCVVSGTDGTTVSYTTVGSCVIDANQAGNASYLSAPMVTRAIVVVAAPAPSRASQTISFASLPKRAHARSAVTVRASASSGLVVSFSTTTPRVCTALPVRGGAAVVLHGPGICTVMASQAGNAHYAPAPPVSGSFTVSKAVQTIRFVAIPHRALAGSTIIVRASASSGLKVGFTGTTPSVCTLVQIRGGARVTLLRAGKCTVVAYQAGNSTFSAASPVGASFTVSARPQHLGAGASGAGGYPSAVNEQIRQFVD